jgi:arylsulfatase A-like enzyme
MLKSGRFKYNYYNAAPSELFDLENDPGECDNLADDPQYDSLRREFHEKLLEKLGESPESIEKRIRSNQAKRQFISDSVAESDTIKKRLEAQIREWRGLRDEPWWDEEGAEYMRNDEPQMRG